MVKMNRLFIVWVLTTTTFVIRYFLLNSSPVEQQQLVQISANALNKDSDQIDFKKYNLVDSDTKVWDRLFNNIIINDVVTNDVMPSYFNLTYVDMVPQYAKYIKETEAIMAARRDRVNTYCNLHGRNTRGTSFLYRMPHNLTYCAVFKAGSTNWKQFFCQLYFPEEYKLSQIDTNWELPYCRLQNMVRFLVRGPVPQVRQGELRYLTIRHPYERLVSMYSRKVKACPLFKIGLLSDILREHREVNTSLSTEEKAKLQELARIECWRPFDERVIDPSNPYMSPPEPTFVEFIRMVISSYLAKIVVDNERHWRPAAQLCAMCSANARYEVIEKFETLERDHHFLLYKQGQLELLPLIAGAHNNVAKRDTTVYDFFKLLDETQLWYLNQIYKQDFELFGYKPHYTVKQKPIID